MKSQFDNLLSRMTSNINERSVLKSAKEIGDLLHQLHLLIQLNQLSILSLEHTTLISEVLGDDHYEKRVKMCQLGLLYLDESYRSCRENRLYNQPSLLHEDIRKDDEIISLLNDPQKLYSLTRLYPEEFLVLHEELSPEIRRGYALDASTSSQFVHHKLTAARQLLAYLFYSDGNHPVLLAYMNDVCPRTLLNAVGNVTAAINTTYKSNIKWPDSDTRRSLRGSFAVDERAIGVIDGTHCEIRCPTYNQILYYSSHKHLHSLNFILIVDIFGFIMYISTGIPGRANDRGAFNNFVQREITLAADEVLIADGGFQGSGNLIFPFTEPQICRTDISDDLKATMIKYNASLTLDRSHVEHAIHEVKSRAQLLQQRFNRKTYHLNSLVHSTARILNRIKTSRIQRVTNR
jgi:hypothetical protein